MSNNKRDIEEKSQEKSFPKVHIVCEKPIYINIHSNYFLISRYFTFLIKKYYNMYGIVKIL